MSMLLHVERRSLNLGPLQITLPPLFDRTSPLRQGGTEIVEGQKVQMVDCHTIRVDGQELDLANSPGRYPEEGKQFIQFVVFP